MKLPDSFLDEVRARTPLPALIGRRMKLSRSGRNWKGCCPFHGEKTPSFYVYDDHYHCFGCGEHGDAVGFVMKVQGATFIEAVTTLAAEAGLEVPKPTPHEAARERERLDLHGLLEAACAIYQENLFSSGGSEALGYLRKRGLTDDTIRRFGLGWSGTGRGDLQQRMRGSEIGADRLVEVGLLRADETGSPIGELFFKRVMFPIRDRRGRTISFGGRSLGEGQPKYVNGPETALFSKRRTLYGIDLAREALRKSSDGLIVVEGYMDVIALHQAGFPTAVAPLGTALTEDQLEELWRLGDLPTLCFDGDEAGARAAARAANLVLPRLTSSRAIRIATLPSGEDPDSLVGRQGPAGFAAVLKAAEPLADALFGLVREGGRAKSGTASEASKPAPARNAHERAQFRERLIAAASRIGDSGLASEYRRALLDRFYAEGRGRAMRVPAPPARGPRPEWSAETVAQERARTLTAILLHNPALLPLVEEAYGNLNLPAKLGRLREAVFEHLLDAATLDSQGLINHLNSLGLAADVAWAVGDWPFPLPACARVGAELNLAEARWWLIHRLMHGGNLDAEIEAATREFNSKPDDAALRRLAALCEERDAWRRGELGAGPSLFEGEDEADFDGVATSGR